MEASGKDTHLLMLSTFRDRHPLGSVVTDLLQVEQGIYVVKAQISVGGIVLGSGMAGSTTVEEAEDAAIQRALRISGINNASSFLMGGAIDSDAIGTSSVGNGSNGASAIGSGSAMSTSSSSGMSFNGSLDTPPLDPDPMDDSSLLSSSPIPVAPLSGDVSNGASSVDDWDAPLPLSEPPPSKPRKATKSPSTKSKAKAEPEEPPPSELPLEPEIEDLSELIAQTDVELTRIGWGPKEGRKFLKDRFSKQSRQQLDESELREFLKELKLQPTKMLDASEF